MQAVIPIAGKGKRMSQTHQGPKQLLPVAGQPLVEYAIASLPVDIDELVLVVGGPHEQQIREYFGTEHNGRRVTYVRQLEPLGLGHAIQQAAPVVNGRFLVVLPDDLYAPEDLQAMIREPDLAVLAKRVERPEHFGVLVCDEAGCLVRAVEKPKEFVSDLVSAGSHMLDREFFDVRVPPSARGEIELPDLLMALVRERGRRVKVLEASFWMAVNDPEQLTKADQEMLKRLSASTKE
ncbi:MAG: nucleotidyltransferase family protein [bacterium]|nr:nucleotidyltransferase family protein [bacterium]